MIRRRHSLPRSARFCWIGLALGLCLCALTAPAPLIPDVQTQTTKWSREWLRSQATTNAWWVLGATMSTTDTGTNSITAIGQNAGDGATWTNTTDVNPVNDGHATLYGARAGQDAYGGRPTMIGHAAGENAARADYVTWLGFNAGGDVTNGQRSTVLGYRGGATSGDIQRSVLIGHNAGRVSTNVSRSIIIGADAGYGAQVATNCILIGDGVSVTNTNNVTIIGNANTTSTTLKGTIVGNAGGLTNVQHILYECGYRSNMTATVSPGAGTWHQITNNLQLGNVTMAGWQVVSNAVQYTNSSPMMVHCALTLSASVSSPAVNISFMLYQNASPIPTSIIELKPAAAGGIESTALHPTFMASQNDVFILRAMVSGAGDITVRHMNMVLFGVK